MISTKSPFFFHENYPSKKFIQQIASPDGGEHAAGDLYVSNLMKCLRGKYPEKEVMAYVYF